MLTNQRTCKMLCELFTLCGRYKNNEITKSQFIEQAEKLADEKLRAENHAERNRNINALKG